MERPSERLEVKLNGEDHEVFMSAAMRTRVVALLEDMSNIEAIFLNPELHEQLFITLLADRDERGRLKSDDHTINDFDLTTEDADKLVDWVGDHVLHFFMRGARGIEKMLKAQQEEIKDLHQSTNGIKASLQESQSAGPMTADTVT